VRGRNVTLATVILLADALGYQVADFFPRNAPWSQLVLGGNARDHRYGSFHF